MAQKRTFTLAGFLPLGTQHASSDLAVIKCCRNAVGRLHCSMLFLAGLVEHPRCRVHPRKLWEKRDTSFKQLCRLGKLDPADHRDSTEQMATVAGTLVLLIARGATTHAKHDSAYLDYLEQLDRILDATGGMVPDGRFHTEVGYVKNRSVSSSASLTLPLSLPRTTLFLARTCMGIGLSWLEHAKITTPCRSGGLALCSVCSA